MLCSSSGQHDAHLRSGGLSVDVCDSGQESVDRFSRHPGDTVDGGLRREDLVQRRLPWQRAWNRELVADSLLDALRRHLQYVARRRVVGADVWIEKSGRLKQQSDQLPLLASRTSTSLDRLFRDRSDDVQ